ncbi:MAG: gluconokinase [Deltaproteobacteria bacterium]|nr:gluconokinase [Deltaproteobacteria bacterium]
MILIAMGVSGCGKSTIGTALARQLGWKFLEGDSFHPAANIEKMSNGLALTDEDRLPWLQKIAAAMHELDRAQTDAVVACSALKASYRKLLAEPLREVRFAWLKATYESTKERLDNRTHFFNPTLLQSQFETLEVPTEALEIDATLKPEQIVNEIIRKLELGKGD